MDKAKRKVRDALANSQLPAVLWSGGKDSMLVLALAREVSNPTVLWFRDGTSEAFAKSIIRDWNLTVFSWAAANRYLLVHEGQTALISEYSFGNDVMPMLTDVVDGPLCAPNTLRTQQLFLPFDVVLWGAKDCDTHWVKGNGTFKEDGFMLGSAKVHAPIRHMTDEQVRDALYNLDIPFRTATDELPMCSHCMDQLEHVELDHFRERFGLEA